MLIVPKPPSTNKLYANSKRGKGRIKTTRYKSWIRTAGQYVTAQRIHFHDCHERFELFYSARRVVENSDIDNLAKPILDMLQHYKIIVNDNMCMRFHGEWRYEGPDGIIVWWKPQIAMENPMWYGLDSKHIARMAELVGKPPRRNR